MGKKGYFAGFYYLIWNISYIMGYFYQILEDPYKVRLGTKNII